MAEKHPEYWKFRFLLAQIDNTIQRAQSARVQLLTEHGLKPDTDYDLNDAEETITEKPHG